jgi:hypothetical protein
LWYPGSPDRKIRKLRSTILLNAHALFLFYLI